MKIIHFLVLCAFALTEEDDDSAFSLQDETNFASQKLPLTEQFNTQETVKEALKPMWDYKTIGLRDLWFELMMVPLAIIYVVNYYVGSRQNRKIAQRWIKINAKQYENQFAEVGTEGHKLIHDGPRDYIFFATGRRFCESIYGQLKLVARHDLFGRYIDHYFFPEYLQDRVQFVVQLNETESDPICFGILPKRKLAKILKKRWDLDNFAKIKDHQGFPKEDYTFLTDCPEFTNALWDLPSVKKALWGSVGLDINGNGVRKPALLQEISLSDLPAEKPEEIEGLAQPKQLKIDILLPKNILENDSEMEDYLRLLNDMIFDIIDLIGTNGLLSADARQRSRKLRENGVAAIMKSNEEKRKKELADKKYAEKKKKLDNLMKLSPAAQRKAEEKIKRQEMKKDMKKRSKNVKA